MIQIDMFRRDMLFSKGKPIIPMEVLVFVLQNKEGPYFDVCLMCRIFLFDVLLDLFQLCLGLFYFVVGSQFRGLIRFTVFFGAPVFA